MEGTGQELAPGLHRIEAPLGERFVACYVISGDDSALLYDSGVDATPAASIVPYCESVGIDLERLRWVVISHCDVDHMGGDAAIKELLPGASLVAHAADQPLIEDVDRIIEERYREFRDDHGIDLDPAMTEWCRDVARAAPLDSAIDGPTHIDLGNRSVEVMHTPGHSEGSIALWDPVSSAALTSDAVLGESLHLADGRPAFPPTYRRPTPYLASISQVRSRRPELLLTAHEPAFRGDQAIGFLERSRRFAERLGQLAFERLELANEPQSTRQLIDLLAPLVGDWDPGAWMFLANGLVGHLEELTAAGFVEAIGGPPTRWQLASGGAA